MLEEKNINTDNSSSNNEGNLAKELNHVVRKKRNLLALAVFLSLVLIMTTYLLSNRSNIYRISVIGNKYLKDEDIIKLSGLKSDDKYILVRPTKIQKQILQDKLIDECNIKIIDEGLIEVSIKEHKIIGYALENDENVLILDNDERYLLNENNIYLLEKVPLIEGFNKEDILLIEKNLRTVGYDVINEISEIHYFQDLKYQNIMLIMRNGDYVFTSAYGLDLLNNYEINSSYLESKNNCYYFEDISGSSYVSACPWQTKEKFSD